MRFIKRTFQLLLLANEPPRRTAFAFALGVFIGCSPLIGLHTILGLVSAQLLKLNKVTVMVGVCVTNPWVIVPYYGFATWFGLVLTGAPKGLALPHAGFREVFQVAFWRELLSHYQLLYPAVLGSSVLAVIFALLAYTLCLHSLRRFAPHRSRQAGTREERTQTS